MLCRFKGKEQYQTIQAKDLTYFLKQNTKASGTLKEPLEIVVSGFLGKEAACEEGLFPWIFSTYDNDRFDERVDPNGWELERYLDNPVVLWAHCHSIPAIGTTRCLIATDSLSGKIRFNEKDIDEFGWAIGERVKAGVLRAGSVGMLVKEIEWVDHKKNPEERCDLIIRKQELLEFSICNVPANPFALQKDSLEECGGAQFSRVRGQSLMKDERTGDPTARSVVGGFWPLRNSN